MSLSQAGLQAVLAQATSEVFLELITISHSEMGETLRLVNDNQDMNRLDGTYRRFPFRIRGMPQNPDRPPTIGITSDAVDQRVVQAVRTIAGSRERASITYEVVRADAPDDPEYGPVRFEFDSAQSDGATSIRIEASFLKGALDDAFPVGQFAPSNRG